MSAALGLQLNVALSRRFPAHLRDEVEGDGRLWLALHLDEWAPTRRPMVDYLRLYLGWAQASRVRRIARRTRLGELYEAHAAAVAEPAPSPEAALIVEQLTAKRRAAVRAEVARLEGLERIVIERHYLGDESIAAVARSLGVSRSYLGKVHRDAVTRLRKRLCAQGK